jgi:hypothetical protein
MSNDVAQGPLIPNSINAKSNYTYKLEADTLYFTTLTDGVATITLDTISGLVNPTAPQDACNKAYADTVLKVVSEPLTSVQYNIGSNNFGGTTNLTYDISTGTLFSNSTVIGTTATFLSISGGVISNVYTPTDITRSSFAMNKTYLDTLNMFTVTSSSGLAVAYSNADMTNNMIIREPASNTTDTIPNASTLLSYIASNVSAKIGTNTRWSVYNKSTTSTLTITPGTGVSFMPSSSTLVVGPQYKVTGNLVSTSTNTLNYVIDGLSYANNNYKFAVGPRSLYTSADVLRVSNSFRFNTSKTTLTGATVIYSPSNVLSVIERFYNGPKTDTFGDVNTFIKTFYTVNSPSYGLFQNGCIELIIRNISPAGSITLVPDSQSQWTMDPNSNNVIGAGKTGYFLLYIDTVAITGNIYVIGID